ncbi:MAG: prolyl-tRNA synthetase, partial [Actinomycetota bacterium]|nr:prolyl-tRNA synthetase [Actinomycetota bacterium]
ISRMGDLLQESWQMLYDDAKTFRNENTHEFFAYDDLVEGMASAGGFWVGAWCGDEWCEKKVTEDTKASIRHLPLEQESPHAPCVVCGKPGTEWATWARAY